MRKLFYYFSITPSTPGLTPMTSSNLTLSNLSFFSIQIASRTQRLDTMLSQLI